MENWHFILVEHPKLFILDWFLQSYDSLTKVLIVLFPYFSIDFEIKLSAESYSGSY